MVLRVNRRPQPRKPPAVQRAPRVVLMRDVIMQGVYWRLYVWELDITWLSITDVDVVNITNKH